MAWEYYKFFHVILALTFFAGTIVSMMAMNRAAKETNVHTAQTLVRMGSFAGQWLITPPLILVGIFGVLAAQDLGYSLTDTGWLNAAYAATAVGLVLGITVMGDHGRKAQRLVDRDVESGEKSDELQAVLTAPLPRIVGSGLHGLVIYVVVLMVFKPF